MVKMWLAIVVAVVALMVAAGAGLATFLVFAQRYLLNGGTCASLPPDARSGCTDPSLLPPLLVMLVAGVVGVAAIVAAVLARRAMKVGRLQQ